MPIKSNAMRGAERSRQLSQQALQRTRQSMSLKVYSQPRSTIALVSGHEKMSNRAEPEFTMSVQPTDVLPRSAAVRVAATFDLAEPLLPGSLDAGITILQPAQDHTALCVGEPALAAALGEVYNGVICPIGA